MQRVGMLVVLLVVCMVGVALAGVTPIGELQRGQSVTVQGEVIRITDEDEFRLRDDTGSVLVYIGWKNRVMVNVGEQVTVEGVVDDDLVGAFRPEIYARTLTREDGSVVQLH